MCGRAVTKPQWTVHLHNGGESLVTEEEAAKLDAAGDMGCYPIGADCLRKHPEVKPYAHPAEEKTMNKPKRSTCSLCGGSLTTIGGGVRCEQQCDGKVRSVDRGALVTLVEARYVLDHEGYVSTVISVHKVERRSDASFWIEGDTMPWGRSDGRKRGGSRRLTLRLWREGDEAAAKKTEALDGAETLRVYAKRSAERATDMDRRAKGLREQATKLEEDATRVREEVAANVAEAERIEREVERAKDEADAVRGFDETGRLTDSALADAHEADDDDEG